MPPDIIDILKAHGLVTTITVEPYLGQSGAGPLYGPAVDAEAYVEIKRRLIRDGAERLVSNSTAYGRLGIDAPIKSRVTVAGVVSYVLAQARHDAPRSALPVHLELLLS